MSKYYDNLQQEAAARWRETQYTRTRQLIAHEQALANMPDVQQAPSLGTAYTDPLLVCPACAGLVFDVRRWACVNGKKDKAELTCASCKTTRTWSWPGAHWIPDHE